MLSRMVPSLPLEMRTLHLLKTPDILCANDTGVLPSYQIDNAGATLSTLISSEQCEDRYPHRVNHDGTIDSICPRCFATIGSSTCEADLERLESRHVCEAARLRHYDEELRRAATERVLR